MDTYIYIKKNIPQNHVELPEPLDPELYDDLGETWEDYEEGKWVLLNDDQVSFLKSHEIISMKEVYNMQIAPAEY